MNTRAYTYWLWTVLLGSYAIAVYNDGYPSTWLSGFGLGLATAAFLRPVFELVHMFFTDRS